MLRVIPRSRRRKSMSGRRWSSSLAVAFIHLKERPDLSGAQPDCEARAKEQPSRVTGAAPGRRSTRSWKENAVLAELHRVQPGIQTIGAQQGLMRAGFGDPTLVQNQDPVGVAHSTQAMGDDQRRAPLH